MITIKTCKICGYAVPTRPDYPFKHLRICESCAARKSDSVNSPNHYTQGKYEVIDYIKDKLTNEQYIGYCLGNVLKYVSRHELKGGKEDLEKAKVYLGWAIDEYET